MKSNGFLGNRLLWHITLHNYIVPAHLKLSIATSEHGFLTGSAWISYTKLVFGLNECINVCVLSCDELASHLG